MIDIKIRRQLLTLIISLSITTSVHSMEAQASLKEKINTAFAQAKEIGEIAEANQPKAQKLFSALIAKLNKRKKEIEKILSEPILLVEAEEQYKENLRTYITTIKLIKAHRSVSCFIQTSLSKSTDL